jgi:aminoacrylate peracid reductase
MAYQPLIPQGAPPSLAPYSPGVRTGNTVYTSGILPLDESGNIVGLGDAAEQTRQVLGLIKSIVEAAGGKMSDIALNTIFLKDLADYGAMNAVYETFFEAGRYPARYCIRADLVKPEFLVEIASIAHLDR